MSLRCCWLPMLMMLVCCFQQCRIVVSSVFRSGKKSDGPDHTRARASDSSHGRAVRPSSGLAGALRISHKQVKKQATDRLVAEDSHHRTARFSLLFAPPPPTLDPTNQRQFHFHPLTEQQQQSNHGDGRDEPVEGAVSYTHLTLPTILLV